MIHSSYCPPTAVQCYLYHKLMAIYSMCFRTLLHAINPFFKFLCQYPKVLITVIFFKVLTSDFFLFEMTILYFNMNFKINLSIFNKNNAVILIGITLNLYVIGGRIDIFTVFLNFIYLFSSDFFSNIL